MENSRHDEYLRKDVARNVPNSLSNGDLNFVLDVWINCRHPPPFYPIRRHRLHRLYRPRIPGESTSSGRPAIRTSQPTSHFGRGMQPSAPSHSSSPSADDYRSDVHCSLRTGIVICDDHRDHNPTTDQDFNPPASTLPQPIHSHVVKRRSHQ